MRPGLVVLVVDAGVADVRRGHDDDLAVVAGVGERLLVAGHPGGEHRLADGLAHRRRRTRRGRCGRPRGRARRARAPRSGCWLRCWSRGGCRFSAEVFGVSGRLVGGDAAPDWCHQSADSSARGRRGSAAGNRSRRRRRRRPSSARRAGGWLPRTCRPCPGRRRTVEQPGPRDHDVGLALPLDVDELVGAPRLHGQVARARLPSPSTATRSSRWSAVVVLTYVPSARTALRGHLVVGAPPVRGPVRPRDRRGGVPAALAQPRGIQQG